MPNIAKAALICLTITSVIGVPRIKWMFQMILTNIVKYANIYVNMKL